MAAASFGSQHKGNDYRSWQQRWLLCHFAELRFPSTSLISVEPFSKNAALLRKTVGENRLSDCQIVETAVSKRTGKVVFGSADSDDPCRSDARIVSDRADGKRFFECDAVTLDALVSQYVVGDVEMLKIDIEGAEYDVFYATSDATFKRIKRIAVETEDLDLDRRHTDALSSFLQGTGFSVLEVTPHLLHTWRA